MNIFVFISGFISGILVASLFKIAPLVGVVFIIVGLAIVCVHVFNSRTYLNENKHYREKIYFSVRAIFFVGLFIIGFGCGTLRYYEKDFHAPNVELQNAVGENVDLVGIVTNEPDVRDQDNRFEFKDKKSGEKILVTVPLFSNVEYGDEVEIKGKLKVPGIITDDAGQTNDFDYGAYLAREDIYYTVSFAQVNVVSHGHGNKIIAGLYSLKQNFEKRVEKILPQPESSLLEGLLVAGKQALPTTILNDFIHAGVVHIVVLSGYNITIVAEFLLLIFSFLALRAAFGASAVGILIFVLMTGATPSIIRAALMALIALGGRLVGRTYSVTRALMAAAFLMLLQNPKILVYDPSFQLSFLATIAMIYVSPVVEKYLTKVPQKFGLRTLISVTLGTQLFVFPYLMYQTGLVSIVSPVSNILILPLVPLTMLVGFIATLLGYISSLIALPLSYPAHLLLYWMLSVAHTLGNMKFASLTINHFPLWATIISYICFIALLYWENKRSSKKEAPPVS